MGCQNITSSVLMSYESSLKRAQDLEIERDLQ